MESRKNIRPNLQFGCVLEENAVFIIYARDIQNN